MCHFFFSLLRPLPYDCTPKTPHAHPLLSWQLLPNDKVHEKDRGQEHHDETRCGTVGPQCHSATVQKPQLQLLGSRHPPDTPDIRTSICIRVCSLARQARPVSSLTKSRDDQGSGVGRQVPAPVKPLATPRSDTGPCKRKTRGKAFWLNHVFSYILIDLHTLLCLCPRLPPLSPLSRDLHKRRRRRERATLRPSSSIPLNLSQVSLLPP